MKVKDLITELQTCDPEALVISHGEVLWFAEELPWYYDGKCILSVEKDGDLVWNTTHNKVRLHTWGMEEWFEFNFIMSHEGYSVPRFSEVVKRMDFTHYSIERDKDRLILRMMNIWFDWLDACEFRLWEGPL